MSSNCQFQSTRYTKNQDGTFTSSGDCAEPFITNDALTDTEENKQTINYLREDRRWRESQDSVGGYAREYIECRDDDDVTKCTHTPAVTARGGDGFAPLTVAGRSIQYNQYGRANAAFSRIHLKEGNQETGYLKIQNPPVLFKTGGKLYEHYREGSGNDSIRDRLGGNVRSGRIHDEKACSLGVSQFCQTEDASQRTFRSNFHTMRDTSGTTIAQQALNIAATPGEANTDTALYNRTRGYA